MTVKHEIISPDMFTSVKVFDFKAIQNDRFIPPHWHRSVEILCCLHGELTVWLGTKNKKMTLKENDVIVLNSNEVHSSQSPCANHVLVIQIPLPYLEKITKNTYNHDWVFNANTVVLPKEKDNELAKIAKEIIQRVRTDSLTDKFFIKGKIYEFLSVLVASYQGNIEQKSRLVSTKNQESIAEIMQYVQEKYQQDISLSNTAEKFNYSDSYFSRLFKKHVGLSFSDYVSSVRVSHAHNLLVNSDWLILDIALDSGFNNPRTFYSAFEKIYHRSPSQYRSEMTKSFRK